MGVIQFTDAIGHQHGITIDSDSSDRIQCPCDCAVAAVIALHAGSMRQGRPTAAARSGSGWRARQVHGSAPGDVVAVRLPPPAEMRAIVSRTIARSASSFIRRPVVHRVDDADDRGVDRRGLLPSASPGRLALDHDEHLLADAGADRIDRQQRRRRAARPSSVSGCTSSSLAPSSLRFFCVDDDGADDAAESAFGLSPRLGSDVPVIDDADNGRVGRRLGGIERKRGFAAADEEDVLADAGADRIERDERAARRLRRPRRAAAARAA